MARLSSFTREHTSPSDRGRSSQRAVRKCSALRAAKMFEGLLHTIASIWRKKICII